jgi:hypothetical protein
MNHVVIGTVKKPITEETKGPMENPRNRLRKVRALSAIYKNRLFKVSSGCTPVKDEILKYFHYLMMA